eukprot:765655-Hanusia_phi.AAC.5
MTVKKFRLWNLPFVLRRNSIPGPGPPHHTPWHRDWHNDGSIVSSGTRLEDRPTETVCRAVA